MPVSDELRADTQRIIREVAKEQHAKVDETMEAALKSTETDRSVGSLSYSQMIMAYQGRPVMDFHGELAALLWRYELLRDAGTLTCTDSELDEWICQTHTKDGAAISLDTLRVTRKRLPPKDKVRARTLAQEVLTARFLADLKQTP